LRTLVISDLHLGLRSGRDRLRDCSDTRARLFDELSRTHRLVLLGDVVELRQLPVREALKAALPVLREIGQALPPDGASEVIVVSGNHDHHLVHGWMHRRASHEHPPPLGTESAVEWRADEPLGAVAAALASGGASVRAAYPGVWLAPRVWATHGHYLDVHTTIPMFERLGAGAMARLLGKPAAAAGCTEDYETVLAPIYAWLHATAQHGTPARGRRSGPGSGTGPGPDPGSGSGPGPGSGSGSGPRFGSGSGEGASARVWAELRQGVHRGGWRRLGLRALLPLMIFAANRAGLGPVRAEIDGAALRRAPLRALDEVVTRLGVDADHVIYGHSHRAGPLPGDDPSEWRCSKNGVRFMNVGCWVHEPAFLGPRPAESPYRLGFAARLTDVGPPELVNLVSGQETAHIGRKAGPRGSTAPGPA
jgi:predicted phosphodiesterase